MHVVLRAGQHCKTDGYAGTARGGLRAPTLVRTRVELCHNAVVYSGVTSNGSIEIPQTPRTLSYGAETSSTCLSSSGDQLRMRSRRLRLTICKVTHLC